MSLNTKTVIKALLENTTPTMTLTGTCRRAKLNYNAIYKRICNNTLHHAPMFDLTQFSKAMGVSSEEFTTLLDEVAAGKFPDDYPLEQIKLEKVDLSHLNDRVIPMLLTEEEAAAINAIRAGHQKRLEETLEDYKKKTKYDSKIR